MQQKERTSFPLSRLDNDRFGEWLLEVPKTGNRQTLHWWRPKRWDGRLSIREHEAKRVA